MPVSTHQVFKPANKTEREYKDIFQKQKCYLQLFSVSQLVVPSASCLTFYHLHFFIFFSTALSKELVTRTERTHPLSGLLVGPGGSVSQGFGGMLLCLLLGH